MTPDEKKQYVDALKRRGQAAVERADAMLTKLAVKSASLSTETEAMHDELTKQLADQAPSQ